MGLHPRVRSCTIERRLSIKIVDMTIWQILAQNLKAQDKIHKAWPDWLSGLRIHKLEQKQPSGSSPYTWLMLLMAIKWKQDTVEFN